MSTKSVNCTGHRAGAEVVKSKKEHAKSRTEILEGDKEHEQTAPHKAERNRTENETKR